MLFETLGDESSGKNPGGFHVCEKLHLHLATFLGNTGFQTLLTRAFALSAEEIPWLRAVRIKPDRTLEGLAEVQAHLDPDELFDGGVVVLAQLLGLLVAFIGEVLTVRLVREVWPTVRLHDLDLGKGIKNEKTK